MADLIPMLAAVAGQAGEEADEDFNQTVLLLHGDGTNGAQNNTFLDGSTNNFTITRNGNTTQGTFTPFSGPNGYWSNFFDGTNDRLTIADNAALRPGTSAFTIEAWVYRAAAGAAHTIFAKGASTPTGFAFLITSSNTLRFTDTSTDITSTGTVAANTWVHVAAVREGTGSNQLKLYINGVQDGTGTSSTDFTQTEEARIGENRGETDDFNGYISNFRYVIGTALYTAGFTPSTSPLTTTSQGATSSQVELLTCQSNRFVDNSTNAFTVSPVNNVRVTPFSPFAPSAAYDPAVNGGSGYFDGTGDYLTGPTNNAALQFGTGDFSIEFWLYLNATGSIRQIIEARTSDSVDPYGVFLDASNQPYLFDGTASRTSSIPCIGSAWNHVVISRVSSTLRIFVNGVQGLSLGSYTTSLSPTGAYLIGDRTFGALYPLNGYLTDLRIVKGSGVTSVTVPTAPLTAITNTSLLCNFTNAGIFDNTGKNNLETVGNAQIDTTTKKYGTGSMEFDGTDDVLKFPPTPDLNLGTGDFTIEFWVNQSANSGYRFIYSATGNQSDWSAGGRGFMIYLLNGVLGITTADTGSTNGSGALSLNTWYHIAVVKNGASFKGYIDGVLNLTRTNSSPVGSDTAGAIIGAQDFFGGSPRNDFNGFIDDFRITKGVARYTANYSAPGKAFPDF